MNSSGTVDFSSLIANHGECECARQHTVRTQCIRIGHDALCNLGEELRASNLSGTALLVADETTYSVAGAQSEKALAAAGSGIINDSCRFVEKRTGLPYIIIGTVPSMDGHVVAPLAVIGGTTILKDAPLNRMAAGFGDYTVCDGASHQIRDTASCPTNRQAEWPCPGACR